MKPSELLKRHREKSGRDPHEVAAAVGISSADYYDLEGFDDLESCIDLGKIRTLASLFGIRSATLFAENATSDKISPTTLASLLEKMIDDRGIPLSQAENEIGWELGPFLNDPKFAILAWNITCLQDVCRALDQSWLAVLNGIEAQDNAPQ